MVCDLQTFTFFVPYVCLYIWHLPNMATMKEIILPPEVNYIAAFLTHRCNINCAYCINRQGEFNVPQEMSAEDWIKGLSRIDTRPDLPISIQGGEPTIYTGFYKIVNALYYQHHKHMDLLTNGMFDLRDFCSQVPTTAFKRGAKYASIRVSYHSKMSPIALAIKAWEMQNRGYEIGIWGLDNSPHLNKPMKHLCECLNLDFREKEFLDEKRGTYKYPEAMNGKEKLNVWCKTSELLIGPSGHVYRCHADLYSNRDWVGHILDDDIPSPISRECSNYGLCNPCDIKLKTNRLQEFGYCAVEIKGKGVRICPKGERR